MTLLTSRRAIVTGGANGIGAAIARRLAGAGATGTVLDLPDAEADPPAGWTAAAVDVRDDDSVARAFEKKRLDVLVAAAGVVPPWTDIASLDLAEWDEVLRVNARGVLSSIKHGARRMASGGSIVVIASLNAWRGDGNLTSYTASKHAALGIVRSAAIDLGHSGIRVNAIAPGPIATEAFVGRLERREREQGIPVRQALADAGARAALGRIASADEVAGAALFLASDLASGITGQLLAVDCGIA